MLTHDNTAAGVALIVASVIHALAEAFLDRNISAANVAKIISNLVHTGVGDADRASFAYIADGIVIVILAGMLNYRGYATDDIAEHILVIIHVRDLDLLIAADNVALTIVVCIHVISNTGTSATVTGIIAGVVVRMLLFNPLLTYFTLLPVTVLVIIIITFPNVILVSSLSAHRLGAFRAFCNEGRSLAAFHLVILGNKISILMLVRLCRSAYIIRRRTGYRKEEHEKKNDNAQKLFHNLSFHF